VVPYSKVTVVDELFGLTVPLNVADVIRTFVAASVVAEGTGQRVVNALDKP
jgi:hypothetical protein